MSVIERYLFRQLLGPTVAAVAALAGIAILSTSLGRLELIVEYGQSAAVFGRITALALPGLLALILPIAIFVAALIALNRLHTEQEIVVCFASGMSRWRVISPAVRLAAIAALVTLAINMFVQPWAQREVRQTLLSGLRCGCAICDCAIARWVGTTFGRAADWFAVGGVAGVVTGLCVGAAVPKLLAAVFGRPAFSTFGLMPA